MPDPLVADRSPLPMNLVLVWLAQSIFPVNGEEALPLESLDEILPVETT